MDRCPREGPRSDLNADEITCPACGRLVELFSDEDKARCSCGQEVRREGAPPEDAGSADG
jgi:hypothetical protein